MKQVVRTRGNASVRVTLQHIGEGYDGDYNPDDPSDEALLRFDVDKREGLGEWEEVENGSFCTNLPDDLPDAIKMEACHHIMDVVEAPVCRGESIKRIAAGLSWLDPSDFGYGNGKEDVDSYHYHEVGHTACIMFEMVGQHLTGNLASMKNRFLKEKCEKAADALWDVYQYALAHPRHVHSNEELAIKAALKFLRAGDPERAKIALAQFEEEE